MNKKVKYWLDNIAVGLLILIVLCGLGFFGSILASVWDFESSDFYMKILVTSIVVGPMSVIVAGILKEIDESNL